MTRSESASAPDPAGGVAALVAPGALPGARLVRQWVLATGERIAVEAFDLPWRDVLKPIVSGTVLHVGSRASLLDANRRWRELLHGCRVIGIDIAPGDNVDVVCDVQAPAQEIRRRCGVAQFDAILCPHVLEHLPAPWEAAKTLQNLLRPGGLLLVTTPWVQGYHAFPEDYWRMSFAGVRRLFARIDFALEFYTGAREDSGYRILRNGRPEHSPETCRIERNLFQFLLDPPTAQPMFDDREGDKVALSRLFMPVCSVNLLGRKTR